MDAAGSPQLRKKLAGAIRFLEEVANLTDKEPPYDFERLRRKLNLAGGAVTAGPAASAPVDIGAMAAPELGTLATEGLDETQLDQAFQTAMRLDAKELAGKFAGKLVDRPANAERPDRYPWYNHLINVALANSDYTEALDRINAGESHDCSHNEGRRRHDYELRRGQVLLKQGEHGQAEEVLGRLVARIPDDLGVPRQGRRSLPLGPTRQARREVRRGRP